MVSVIVTLGAAAQPVGDRILRWADANAVADVFVDPGFQQADLLAEWIKQQTAAGPGPAPAKAKAQPAKAKAPPAKAKVLKSIGAYVLIDTGEMRDPAVLANVLADLRKRIGNDSGLWIHVVAILPHPAASEQAHATAYKTIATLRLDAPAAGRKPLFHRLWVVSSAAQTALKASAEVEARLSQWLLTRIDGEASAGRIKPSPEIHTIGIWAAGGAPDRARALRDTLARMLPGLAPETPPRGIRNWLRKSSQADPGMLNPLYIKAAEDFPGAEADSVQIASKLLLMESSDRFWDDLAAELDKLGPFPNPSDDAAAAAQGPSGWSRAAEMGTLRALVGNHRETLRAESDKARARIDSLGGFETGNVYQGSLPLILAGRRAAVDVLSGLLLTHFDEKVYFKMENKLRGLLAIVAIERWLGAFADALDGGAAPAGPAPSARLSDDDVEKLLVEGPAALRLALLTAIERIDPVAAPIAADAFAAGQARAIADAAGPDAAIPASAIKGFAGPGIAESALDALPKGSTIGAAPHMDGFTLVAEGVLTADASPVTIKQGRAAFLKRLSDKPGIKAKPVDERLFDDGLVVALNAAEQEKRARVALDLAHALVLGTIEEHADGLAFSRGSFDRTDRVAFASPSAALAALLGNAALLTDVQAATSARVTQIAAADVSLKLKLLVGELAKGALKDLDARIGGALAGEEKRAAGENRVAVLHLRKSMDSWTVGSPGPLAYKRLLRNP